MRNILLLLFLFCLLTGCNDQKSSYQDTVTSYYSAFNAHDYNEIKTHINDRFTIAEGDYVTTYTRDSYYKLFTWDSIFKTSYNLIELEERNNQVIATVASTSVRYEFLKNNPLTCQFKISFDSRKISKIETLECKDANWDVWQQERDSLVRWINKYHPDLDGFINDLTMNGAIHYLEAIELYENKNGAL